MGIFKRKAKNQVDESGFLTLQLGSYGGLTPVFTAAARDDLELNEAVASCLQTNSAYCSKAEFSSVRIKEDGEQFHDYPELDKLLQYSPNPLMTAAVFWERTSYYYFKYNNAFIYKELDPYGKIVALWSVDPSRVEFDKISTGEILLKFTIQNKQIIIPYSEIIHIQREVVDDPMFGRQNDASIAKVVNLINLNYKGIERAIMTSQFIRFLGKVLTKMNRTELKKKAKEFTADYLNVQGDNQAAVIFHDSSFELEPVAQQAQKTANYAEANQWNQAVYKYYGCPEKVIAGTATEDEMTSYYERTPENFFIRVAQEMTRKIFTDKEFSFGNRIVYSSQKFIYMSMKTRLELFKTAREIGAFTLGTLGDILGLPVPSGKRNTVVTSQNYSGNQNQNQSQNPGEDGKNDEKESGSGYSNKQEEDEDNAT